MKHADEIYSNIIDKISQCSKLSECDILQSNKENCVDARYVLVHILSQSLTDNEIADVTGLSRTCANKIRNSFKYKIRKISVQSMLSEF